MGLLHRHVTETFEQHHGGFGVVPDAYPWIAATFNVGQCRVNCEEILHISTTVLPVHVHMLLGQLGGSWLQFS